MHILANLCARADSGPGVYHGAFVHVGANVDEGRHQDHTLGQIAATARHGRWHHAHAGGFHAGFVEVGELGGYLVEKAQVAGAHDFVVLEAKAQQHRFLDPLVRGPLAHALTRGDAQMPGVELGDDVLDRLSDFLGRGFDRNIGAVVPRGVYDFLELLAHDNASFRLKMGQSLDSRRRGNDSQAQLLDLTNWTMRWAASTHSAVSATRAMRMRCAPGFAPCASRARKVPGKTVTL